MCIYFSVSAVQSGYLRIKLPVSSPVRRLSVYMSFWLAGGLSVSLKKKGKNIFPSLAV
jgi:hypothetical protein